MELAIDRLLSIDEDILNESGIPHLFHLDTLLAPSFCSCCNEMIMGLSRQAYICSECDVVIHRRCIDDMPCTCTRSYETKEEYNYSGLRLKHKWAVDDYPLSSLCYVCHSKILFSEGFECSRCERIVHKKCMHEAPSCIPRHLNLLYTRSLLKKKLPSQTPLLVFINTKSGGLYGEVLYQKFCSILSKDQVFILDSNGPREMVKNLRILACGGDGTIGWIMNEIDKISFKYQKPPIAILPLGTGNDLSRSLCWGRGYDGESLSLVLNNVSVADEVHLDRWKIGMTHKDDTIMNNYMSIGVDAKVALEFHRLRDENPSIFLSQSINKIWYATLGTKSFLESHQFVDSYLTLVVDGETIPLPEHITGLVFLNIHHYAGGAKTWGDHESEGFKKSEMDDGLLEIGFISTPIHMGLMSVELDNVKRLSQGKEILIKVRFKENEIPIQIDGEPFLIENDCDIYISYFGKSVMLKKECLH